ncbi:hypothetical protein F1D05_18440 [Kribbella qitaiheensis]|uniref:Uncharacterized protein n=1 Tax=Kribbella qitaiheensis TaxID=1544730 RepID=A0A7G6WZW7_9ACTN|nr:hypothetical protein [Kribbella qitaiheensis]QNE19532.1 hypothetical protein F1D05_18440 [Kribbella qitaiheensis]
MGFETELSDRLHAEADDTPVDLGPLLTGSVAYGNKLVRRRRLTQIFAGAAAVAVLGGAFAYAGSLAHPGAAGFAPAGSTGAQQTGPITPQAAAKILLDALPDAGKASHYRGGVEGIGTPDGVYADLDYTDGGSTAMVRVRVLSKADRMACVPQADQSCRIVKLADGSRLQLVENQSNGSSGNYKHLQANLVRADGLVVTLLAENRESENPNTSPTRAPLSLAQLQTAITDPHWQRQLDQAFLDASADLFVPSPVTRPSAPTSPGASK